MKNLISIFLVSFFLTCGVTQTVVAYSANSINKKILAVQAEIVALEEDLADVETPSVKKIGERKLRGYRREISQLRKDLQIIQYREKVKKDRDILKKHR